MGFKVEIWTEVDDRVVRRVRKGTGGRAELAAVLEGAVDASRAELGLPPGRSGLDELREAFAAVPIDTWGSLLWTLVNKPTPGTAKPWALLPLRTREGWSRSAVDFLSHAVRWAQAAQDGREARDHVDTWWAEIHRGMAAFAATARAFREAATGPAESDTVDFAEAMASAQGLDPAAPGGFRVAPPDRKVRLHVVDPDAPPAVVLPRAEDWADLLRLAGIDGEPNPDLVKPWAELHDSHRHAWVRRAERFREALLARLKPLGGEADWNASIGRVRERRTRLAVLERATADELGDPSAEVLAGWLGSALSETEGMPHGALIEDVKGDPERLHLFLSAMAQRVLERSAAAGARMVADVTRGVPAKVLAGWLRVALEGAERELDTPVGDASGAPDEWEAMLTLAAAGVLRQAAAADPTPAEDEGRSGTETAALELGGRLTAQRLREVFERAERDLGMDLAYALRHERDWRAMLDRAVELLPMPSEPQGRPVDESRDTGASYFATARMLGRWMGEAIQGAARAHNITAIRIPRDGDESGSAGPLMEAAAARLLDRLGMERRRMVEAFSALAPVVPASEPGGFERFVTEQSIDSPGDPTPMGSGWGSVQSAYSTTLSRYHRVLTLLGGRADPHVIVAGSEMNDPSVRAVRVLAHLDRAVDLLYTRDRANPDLWWVSGRDDDGRLVRADRPITWPVVPGAAVVVRDDEARAYVVEGETRDGRPGWEVWALEDLDSDGVFRRLVTYPSEQREQAFGFAEHVNAKARPAFLDCAHVSGSADGRTCDACHLPMPGRS
ncbi:MAG: hypothetical protein HOY78_02135 [Saccharothrix sp.]|nr:hypothetical protein [Saccharothrix sp.]